MVAKIKFLIYNLTIQTKKDYKLMGQLKYVSDFLNYPVPLGILVVALIIVSWIFTKSYNTMSRHYIGIFDNYVKYLESRDKRINKLEKDLDKCIKGGVRK